jgi:hypothetical protein
MIMRKYLPLGLGATVIVALVSLTTIKNSNSSEYTPRDVQDAADEPYFMKWAQVDVRTGEFNPNARNEVRNQLQNFASRVSIEDIELENMGPNNVGGRTRAIIEIFGKPDTMLVGSVSGGLFISYDAGGNWEPHEQFKNLDSTSSIISAIHQDTVSGRIYVGTGCTFDDSWPGYGIFVSDDDGITFSHLSSTTPDNRLTTGGDWLYNHRIRTAVDGTVYAATARGLKISEDEGETWIDAITPNVGNFADVLVTKEGRVIASRTNGGILISETGEAGTFEEVSQTGMPSGTARTAMSFSPKNPDHIYIVYVNSNSCLNSVWETNDGGELWTQLLVPFDDFEPMNNSEYCQGIYDLCIGVSPLDDDLFFLGGVQLWRYDGNLTRVASEGGGPPFGDVLPNYVHADKHYVYFSPNNPNRVYVTSDGGIATSIDNGATWSGRNKGYTSTQFYAIAHSNDGDMVLGGTQDNGTLIVLGSMDQNPNFGLQLTGGDGMGCDMSQISSVVVTSSQNGAVYRMDLAGADESSQPPRSFVSSDGGPFVTRNRIWENVADESSKDSVEFSVESSEAAIDVSNGIVKTFEATVTPVQPEAIVIGTSISVFAGGQSMSVSATDSTLLEGNGESTGTISYNENGSFNVTVSFNNAPAENTNIYVKYDQRFKANSLIYLESENLSTGLTTYEFEHRLENSLSPGDVIKVQDPVQSMLASTGGVAEGVTGGVRIYRGILNFLETATPINIPGVTGNVSEIKFSKDGNHMFVGNTSGNTYRVSGLLDLYTEADLNNVTVTVLPGGAVQGGVTGIAIDPANPNRIVVTAGGYGSSNNIREFTNVLTAPTVRNLQGNLVSMPVYDAVIAVDPDGEDTTKIIIGTEFGLWATETAADGSPTWEDVNNPTSYCPIYAVRQQSLPWTEAKNSGMLFLGTYGRGMWKSGTYTLGIKDVDPLPSRNDAISGLKVYPNPMKFEGTIEFETSFNGSVDLAVYDLNGRIVYSKQERVVSGSNNININTSRLQTGTYYATLTSGESRQVAKIMVFK